ncbi:MAG: ester cyclase [Dehalococcoidales bacterium]
MDATSLKRQKTIERRIVAEVLNEGNLAVLDECLRPDFVYHGPGGADVKGIADYKKFLAWLRAAYPDIQVTIEDILAEADLVATRTFCTFTSAGKKVTMSGAILDRFKDGKILETWEHYDRLDLMQQLGLIPPRQATQSHPGENLTGCYIHLPKKERNFPHCPLSLSKLKYENRKVFQISNLLSPLFHMPGQAHV